MTKPQVDDVDRTDAIRARIALRTGQWASLGMVWKYDGDGDRTRTKYLNDIARLMRPA